MNTETFTKIEAINSVASVTGHTQKVSEHVIEAFLNQIEVALAQGRRIEFRGFGTWEVRTTKPRIGRNPRDPESGDISIPPRSVVRFRVGKNLRQAARVWQKVNTPVVAQVLVPGQAVQPVA